jgi:hypothetical protein
MLKRKNTVTCCMLCVAFSGVLSNTALCAHPDDAVVADIQMRDSRIVRANWYDLESHSFELFWNSNSKTAVVRVPGDRNVYRYDKMSDAQRSMVDDAVRFQEGLGALKAAQGRTSRNPLKVNFQMLVGIGVRGEQIAILTCSATERGYQTVCDSWQAVLENHRRNEPARRLEQESRNAEQAAREAKRAAMDAEWAAREASREMRRTVFRLQELGLIP